MPLLSTLLAACVTQPVEVPPPAPAASAPLPAAPAASAVVIMVPAPIEPADQVSRQILGYHEQIRQMPAADLGNEITRLNAIVSANSAAAPTGAVLELALALSQQHNGGDVARAAQLLESVVKAGAPELQPWQPMARLLLARVTEQRRLEDAFNREAAQRRDQQRTLQQLNEKLEALKAIERSMTTRPGSGAAAVPVTPVPAAPAAASAPSAPKAP
ncbi:hypothetical protein [Rhizobacter sp. OV335]|uniref:hypothetical protein n=1 Tax=Rhizobacter sp. OV335 TaxID=1500264 RepID=UPI0009241133|nr:hypothetical protein [Rhizobacter sp. OV335]SHM26655.1 hypothetical protein SAMN02787076_00903 [Rhizobacter sp. OV335]